MSGGGLEGFWRLSKGFLEDTSRVSADYPEGVWKMSDWCLLGIKSVSGSGEG